MAWAAALGDDDPLLGALDLDEDDCEELGDPVGSETGGTGTEGTETVGTGTGGTGTEGTETVGVERGDA